MGKSCSKTNRCKLSFVDKSPFGKCNFIYLPLPLVRPCNKRASGLSIHSSQRVGTVSETLPETKIMKKHTNRCWSQSYNKLKGAKTFILTCPILSLLFLLPLSKGQEWVGGTEGWTRFTKSRETII